MASASKSVSRAAAPARPLARMPVPGVSLGLGGDPLLRCCSRRRWLVSSRGSCATRVAMQEVNGTSYSKDIEETAVLKIVDSLEGEDKTKALALWEENKRMRVKLAILEGISELPPGERMRALSLLKKNRSLRYKTNSLMASWADMEGTVNSLIKAEVEAAGGGSVSESDVYLSSNEMDMLSGGASPEAPAPEENCTMFWDVGLSATGIVTLLASTGPLELALAKASIILRDNTDEILNNYWERELGMSQTELLAPDDEAKLNAIAFAEESAAAVHDDSSQSESISCPPTALPVTFVDGKGDGSSVSSTQMSVDEVFQAAVLSSVQLNDEDKMKEEGKTEANDAREIPKSISKVDVEERDNAKEVEAVNAEEATVSDDAMALDAPMNGETPSPAEALPSAMEAQIEQQTSKAGGGRGGMAAVAGLGAGLLAVAAGLEATAAIEIMATTALITSAGSIMSEESETGSVRKKGAGAPALVAIAATLNAADQVAKSIDRALESEVVKATSEALGSANKIRAMGEPKLEDKVLLKAHADEKDELIAAPIQQPSTDSAVNVIFSVKKDVPFGQEMKVVGSCSALGDWDASKAMSMNWNEDTGTWTAAAQIPNTGFVEFKFLVGCGDDWSWEAPLAGNRRIQVPDADAVSVVRCVFDDIEAVHVVPNVDDEAIAEELPTAAVIQEDAPVSTSAVEENHPQTEILEMQMPNEEEKLIMFRVQKEVPFGTRVMVVGSPESLGSWDSERAVPLEWGNGHVWSAHVPMHPGLCEFKFMVASDSGDYIHWEAIPGNRKLQVPSDGSLILAEADFDGDEIVRVSIDEEVMLPADNHLIATC